MFDDKNLPPGLDPQDWEDFKHQRELLGKKMTDMAKRRMLMKLHRMSEAGEPIDQVIDRSIVNGWQDVYPLPPELRIQGKPLSHREYKREPEPEKKISDEERESNIRKLHDEINKKMNISGGRR